MNDGVEFLPEAFREVEEATLYYQACDPDLGFRFRQLVENAVGRLPVHLCTGMSGKVASGG